MKTKEISVTISHNISIGKYEHVKPNFTISAEIEEGDDLDECVNTLHKVASKYWAKIALKELSWAASRRDSSTKHEFETTTKETRNQIKTLLR